MENISGCRGWMCTAHGPGVPRELKARAFGFERETAVVGCDLSESLSSAPYLLLIWVPMCHFSESRPRDGGWHGLRQAGRPRASSAARGAGWEPGDKAVQVRHTCHVGLHCPQVSSPVCCWALGWLREAGKTSHVVSLPRKSILELFPTARFLIWKLICMRS